MRFVLQSKTMSSCFKTAQPWAAIAANLQMLLMSAEVGTRKRALTSKYAVRRHARAASQLHPTPCFLPRAMP